MAAVILPSSTKHQEKERTYEEVDFEKCQNNRTTNQEYSLRR